MQSLRRIAVLVAVSAAFVLSLAEPPPAVAAEVIVVPPGNRSEKQPKVYYGSKFLTGGAESRNLRRQVQEGLCASPEGQEADRQDQAGGRGLRRRPGACDRGNRRRAHLQHRHVRHASDLLRQGAAIRRQRFAQIRLQGTDGGAAFLEAAVRQMRADEDHIRGLGLPADRVEPAIHGQGRRRQALLPRPAAQGLLQTGLRRPDLRLRTAQPGCRVDGHRRRARQERSPAAYR